MPDKKQPASVACRAPPRSDHHVRARGDRAALEETRSGSKDQGWACTSSTRSIRQPAGRPRGADALRLMGDPAGALGQQGRDRSCSAAGRAKPDVLPRTARGDRRLGSTFGPEEVDLVSWKQQPIWIDPPACRVSMKSLPFNGDVQGPAISEEGRQLAETAAHAHASTAEHTLRGVGRHRVPARRGDRQRPAELDRRVRGQGPSDRIGGPCPK